MSHSIYKQTVFLLVLFSFAFFLGTTNVNAQAAACVGGVTGQPAAAGLASSDKCPANTCFVEDTQSNCLDPEGRCSVFRCYTLPVSPDVTGTCVAAAVFGEPGGLMVDKNECREGYKPVASESLGFTAQLKCECVPNSDTTPASRQVCAKEYQDCSTDADCTGGGVACEKHTCIDIDPTSQVVNKCIAPDSPYGKQYTKAFIEPVSGGGIVCDPNKNGEIVKNLPSRTKIAEKYGATGLEAIAGFIGDFGKNTILGGGNGATGGINTLTEQKKKGDELRKQVDDEYRSQVAALPKGVMTAIGCVPTEPKPFVVGMFKFISLGAGGIAFLLMILGALQMITAEGNPENIKNAQEKFYSAIIGLLFIIFAVLLLQVIGYDILGLPGFGR